MDRRALIRALLALALSLAALIGARDVEGSEDVAARRRQLEEQAAGEDTSVAVEALHHLGQLDEDALNFAAALAHYEAAYARSPSHRRAARVSARAETLRQHAEGGFVPYARLERVRRDPALSSDAVEVDRLRNDSETFPPGAVRAEARMFVAEAYLRRLDRPDDALPLLRAVVDDPAADDLLARRAARDAVEMLVARGDLASAARVAGAPRAEPSLRVLVHRQQRRRALHKASLAALVALAVGCLVAVVRRRGAATAQGPRLTVVVGFLVWVSAAGGLLATTYEEGRASPFLIFGVASLPVLLAARWWGRAGSRSVPARAGRALLSATAVVATAFLVLERVDATYLEGFGL